MRLTGDQAFEEVTRSFYSHYQHNLIEQQICGNPSRNDSGTTGCAEAYSMRQNLPRLTPKIWAGLNMAIGGSPRLEKQKIEGNIPLELANPQAIEAARAAHSTLPPPISSDLFESQPLATASKRKRLSTIDSRKAAMIPFIFPNLFHNYTPTESQKLTSLYQEYGGILPSRRQLRQLALDIGISQGKIRRWFALETESTSVPARSSSSSIPLAAVDAPFTPYIEEAKKKVEEISRINQSIERILSNLH